MPPCPAAATQRLHCSPPQSLARVVAWARAINLSSIISAIDTLGDKTLAHLAVPVSSQGRGEPLCLHFRFHPRYAFPLAPACVNLGLGSAPKGLDLATGYSSIRSILAVTAPAWFSARPDRMHSELPDMLAPITRPRTMQKSKERCGWPPPSAPLMLPRIQTDSIQGV